MKIYIEELIFVNAIMYLTFLILIKNLYKFETSKPKLFVSALIGGLASCVIALSTLTKLETIFFEFILISFLSSWTFKNLTTKKMLTTIITIIFLSNLYISILNLFNKFYIKSNTIIFSQMPTILSLALLFAIAIFAKFIFDTISIKVRQSSNLVETELEYHGKKIRTIGLVDTGNNLMHKNMPVSFINFDLFSTLTGISLSDFLAKKYSKIDSDFVDVNSLAGNKKLLLIKLNKIKLKINDKYKIIENPQVAISLKINKKDYKMVLNHNIL